MATQELKISKCCEVEAYLTDELNVLKGYTCSECGKECELQPREWRWWEDDSGTQTDKLLQVKQAFAIGATDKEACFYAGISEKQLYYYQRVNPRFVSEKELLKEKPVLAARQTVVKAITGGKMTVQDAKTGNVVEVDIIPDKDLAFRFLERKAKDFKPKQVIEHEGAVVQRDETLDELMKNATPEQRENLLNAIDALTHSKKQG